MSRLLEILRSRRVLLMDGAMGTELMRRGLKPGTPAEAWNLTHAQEVGAVHEAYVAAGAECLVANTFLGSPGHLRRHGLEDRLEEINAAGLELARRAAGPERIVLASIGPLAAPGQKIDVSDLQRTLDSLRVADGILFETWSDPGLLGSLASLPRGDSLPWLISFSFGSGLDVSAAGSLARGAAATADAIGVNCGQEIDFEKAAAILRGYRAAIQLPMLARLNAGTPNEADGQLQFPRTPKRFADEARVLLQAGATLLGGCCGTTPAHIAALLPLIDDWNSQ